LKFPIENIWDGLSGWFRNKIYHLNEDPALPIFSLKRCLQKGKIRRVSRERLSEEEVSKIRENLLRNLPGNDDLVRLLERTKNIIFEYFQNSYGAFGPTEAI